MNIQHQHLNGMKNSLKACKPNQKEILKPVLEIGPQFFLLESVQSALSDLLTTSATHGTFSRPSTKRGLILIGLELNTNARESFEHCRSFTEFVNRSTCLSVYLIITSLGNVNLLFFIQYRGYRFSLLHIKMPPVTLKLANQNRYF